jgi:uncharacterized protein (DUF608 family)
MFDSSFRFPFANTTYTKANFPVQVTSEVYNPFVPFNVKDTGLPGDAPLVYLVLIVFTAVIFNYTFKNTTSSPVQVSFMMTQQNLVGWDGVSAISGSKNAGYGGNVNTATQFAASAFTYL